MHTTIFNLGGVSNRKLVEKYKPIGRLSLLIEVIKFGGFKLLGFKTIISRAMHNA